MGKQRARESETRMNEVITTLEADAEARITKTMLAAKKAKADYEAERASQLDKEVKQVVKGGKQKFKLDIHDRSTIVKEVLAKSQEKALQDHLNGAPGTVDDAPGAANEPGPLDAPGPVDDAPGAANEP